MKTIGLTINQQRDPQLEYAKMAVSILRENGFAVLLNEHIPTLTNVDVLEGELFYKSCDAIVTLGGDGTILRVATMAAKYQKPILGVNLGHLGYLTQLEKHEILKLPKILQENTTTEQRFMLKLFIENKDGSVETHYALNDITLSRQIVSNSLNVSLYANDEFVYKFRSDGLIFATPTGSTAYSMSSGGPIADCTLNDIIIVTPVCEHSFFSKSMIFSATDSLCCCIEDTPENSYIVVDGKVVKSAENVRKVIIVKSDHSLSLFRLDGKRFYRVLNSKFSDGGINERFTSKGDH